MTDFKKGTAMPGFCRTISRLIVACSVTLVLGGVCTGVASAQTFYVNQRNAESPGTITCGVFPGGHEATHENPCKTITEAIKKAEGVKGPNTIEVSPEENELHPFKEQIHLASAADNGLTINGEEPGVTIVNSGAGAMEATSSAGSVTLSNVRLATTGAPAVNDLGANVTLINDTVEAESTTDGVRAVAGGSLTINSGSVIMESDSGDAVYAHATPLMVTGATIINGNGGIGSESGGIYSEGSTLVVASTKIGVEGGASTTEFGIAAGKDSAATVQNTSIQQGSPSMGAVFELTRPTVSGLRVEMVDPASIAEAVLLETEGGSSSFERLETLGTWTGPAMEVFAGDVTLSDSRVRTSGSSSAEALRYGAVEATRGLVVQRSVLQAGPGATATLDAKSGNATLDSSEILGGKNGVFFEALTNATDALTVSASTVDAGAPGTAADGAGVNGIEAVAKSSGSIAKVAIQGSIVLETQTASTASGGQVSVTCSYSALPSQAQAASGGSGGIACANGTSGNTESNPVTTLFAEPLSNYLLGSTSSAVDSVPAGAIALPFGIAPSATDFAGNPRILDGNGDCVALQDKGALELQGHSAPCSKPAPKPIAGSITNLSISPNAFLAAPSGATVSKKKKAKKHYGTTISYKDSQAATTTFTVLKPSSGRKKGKSCKKPGRANKHGKRCTIYTAIGSFTHTDTAGANKFHFSGRLKGKKLGIGSYKLQAVAHNAAGNGTSVNRQFKIK